MMIMISQMMSDNKPNKSDTDTNSDVNIEDIDDFTLTSTIGCTVEVKSDIVTDAGINKCFFNMFGSGTRLGIMLLEAGNIIKCIWCSSEHAGSEPCCPVRVEYRFRKWRVLF